MQPVDYLRIARNGLWKQNPGIAQLIGLCPLLAISTNVVNAVSLGLATILVMAVANLAVASLRNLIPHEIRIPTFVLIIAALVSVIDMAFDAWFHSLYLVLGIFVPLIVTNCIVLARIEAFAAKNPVWDSTYDGIMMGSGLVLVLAVLGALRELIGGGTLLSGIDMIFEGAQPLRILPESYPGFLVALLPPGAFLLLGCLIAGKNWLDERAAARTRPPVAQVRAAGA